MLCVLGRRMWARIICKLEWIESTPVTGSYMTPDLFRYTPLTGRLLVLQARFTTPRVGQRELAVRYTSGNANWVWRYQTERTQSRPDLSDGFSSLTHHRCHQWPGQQRSDVDKSRVPPLDEWLVNRAVGTALTTPIPRT